MPGEVPSLSVRLRALVVTHAGARPLTCTFAPGGKLHGVGIPSVLWCLTCGQAAMWHDVGAASAVVARAEASERLPFLTAEELLAPANGNALGQDRISAKSPT